MKTNVPLLNTIMTYIVKRKGKQIRPMFVLFCSKLHGEINERTYRGASLIELLHTATLVHDDVVDGSDMRRGFFSINALWKNKIAVLVGDFLLAKGLLLSIDNDDFDMLKIVSESVKKMSEGELLQLEKARRLDITEEVYYDIITKKTASLIASCCALGAAAAHGRQVRKVGRCRPPAQILGADAGIAEVQRLHQHIGVHHQLAPALLLQNGSIVIELAGGGEGRQAPQQLPFPEIAKLLGVGLIRSFRRHRPFRFSRGPGGFRPLRSPWLSRCRHRHPAPRAHRSHPPRNRRRCSAHPPGSGPQG